ncbi:MAG: CRTAC1 family protein [Isosphaeraceae bacterium]|nr:CRTAC1 family protein [Isosphaeraceae bacterium]
MIDRSRRLFIASARFAALLVAGPAFCGCGGERSSPDPPPRAVSKPAADPTPSPSGAEAGPFRFTDVTAASGVDFVHVSGMTEEKLFPTANGSGIALLDYDGDGRLDIYCATGNSLPLAPSPKAANRLYRNLGGLRFEDVTEKSGTGFRGYCHGVLAGDIDNDGDPDLFLSNFGANALLRNNGDGTFTDIGRASGVATEPNWSSSAAFLDFDRDGRLDIYVSRYGDWQYPRDHRFCGDPIKKIRRYCSPKELTPVRHVLWRNRGDGTFEDATEKAGIARADGHGFAAVAADLDGDSRVDLYVANDQDPNFLFLNEGNGRFRDATTDSGAGFDSKGQTQSGMGVEAEDMDGDGRPELFVTNFQEEPNTLYRNLGRGLFLDATAYFGLAVDSLPWIGWGCSAADLDRDGRPDLVVANAHIDDNADLFGQPSQYAEPPLIYRNRDGKRFVLANRGAGDYFQEPHLGHAVVAGDLDDDGDLDLVFGHKDGPLNILRNDTPGMGAWIRLSLEGRASPRDAVGATLEVTVGGRTLHRLVKSGHGLMSSPDPRLLVGLGDATGTATVRVKWPSGRESVHEGLAPAESHRLVEPALGD